MTSLKSLALMAFVFVVLSAALNPSATACIFFLKREFQVLFQHPEALPFVQNQAHYPPAQWALVDLATLNTSSDPLQAYIYRAKGNTGSPFQLVLAHGKMNLGSFPLSKPPKKLGFVVAADRQISLMISDETGQSSFFVARTHSNLPRSLDDFQSDTSKPHLKIQGEYNPNILSSYLFEGYFYHLSKDPSNSLFLSNGALSFSKGGFVLPQFQSFSSFAASRTKLALVQDQNMIFVWDLFPAQSKWTSRYIQWTNSPQTLSLANLKNKYYTSLDDPYVDVEIIHDHVLLTRTKSGKIKLVDLNDSKLMADLVLDPVNSFRVAPNGVMQIVYQDGTAQILRFDGTNSFGPKLFPSKRLTDVNSRKIVSVYVETETSLDDTLVKEGEVLISFGFENGTLTRKSMKIQ